MLYLLILEICVTKVLEDNVLRKSIIAIDGALMIADS